MARSRPSCYGRSHSENRQAVNGARLAGSDPKRTALGQENPSLDLGTSCSSLRWARELVRNADVMT